MFLPASPSWPPVCGQRSLQRARLRNCANRSSRLVQLSLCALVFQAHAASADDRTNPLVMISFDDLVETQHRPLFSPTRRPPPPPAAPSTIVSPVELPPPAPPKIVLLGIMADEEGRWAVIRLESVGRIGIVQEGDEINGWKVSEIQARKAILVQGLRSSTVTLFQAPHTPPTATVREARRRK
jgi:hypothetical protein